MNKTDIQKKVLEAMQNWDSMRLKSELEAYILSDSDGNLKESFYDDIANEETIQANKTIIKENKKMSNKKFMETIEEFFGIWYGDDKTVELETWTDGGVNMHIILDNEKESYLKQFENYINNFDIDEEIELHRQMKDYKNDFTIRESLEDFEAYKEWLANVHANILSDNKGV